jgi:hypothetical protein
MIQEASLFAFRTTDRTRDSERILMELRHAKGEGHLGLTTENLEVRLMMRHATASARVCDLVKQGRVRWTGCFSKTSSGCKAQIVEAVEP